MYSVLHRNPDLALDRPSNVLILLLSEFWDSPSAVLQEGHIRCLHTMGLSSQTLTFAAFAPDTVASVCGEKWKFPVVLILTVL